MDSRDKILSGPEAAKLAQEWRAAGLDVQLAAGWFDPMLAESAEELARLKRPGAKLMILLDEPPEAILAWRARAEMVAALRPVDAVAPFSEVGLTPSVDLREQHGRSRSEFIGHVFERMS